MSREVRKPARAWGERMGSGTCRWWMTISVLPSPRSVSVPVVCMPLAVSTQATRSGGTTSVNVALIRWLPCSPIIRVSNRPPARSSTTMPSSGVRIRAGPRTGPAPRAPSGTADPSSRGARNTRRWTSSSSLTRRSPSCRRARFVSSRSMRSDHARRLSSSHDAAGLQRLRLQPARPGLPVPAAADQAAPLEHPDVLRHGLQAHRVRGRQLLDRRLALTQPGHDVPPGAIGERGEHRVEAPVVDGAGHRINQAHA